MVLDNRTKEQRVIDTIVAAKLALDGPDADRWRSIVAEKREQLDGFVAASKRREDDLLHKQAMELDEFSRSELNEQVGLQSTLDAYTEKLGKLAAQYAEAFDAVRGHYASVYPGDDPAVSIRKVLAGDAHPGASVETFLNIEGGLVTRIRRGVHNMTTAEVDQAEGRGPSRDEIEAKIRAGLDAMAGPEINSEAPPEAGNGSPGVEVAGEAERPPVEPPKKPWPYSFSPRPLDQKGEDTDKG